MIGVLKVSAPQMQAAASNLNTYVGEMQNAFQSMKTIMEQSVSYWVGEAGDTHRELYQEQIGQIEEILARYREHINDLNTMAGVYHEAEASAQSVADELPMINL